MNKRTKVYMVLIVWVGALIQIFINKGVDREKSLVQAMAYCSSDTYETRISANGFYDTGYYSEETRRLVVERLAKLLSIDSGYDINVMHGLSSNTVLLTMRGKYAETEIRMIENFGEKENVNDYYIDIRVTVHELLEESLVLKERIEDIYEGIGINPSINFYVKGVTDGGIEEVREKEIIDKFMNMMNARIVLDTNVESAHLIYGYTKEINRYVYQDNKKVNVNIAFSYDEVNDKTYIHMAEPFIDSSF